MGWDGDCGGGGAVITGCALGSSISGHQVQMVMSKVDRSLKKRIVEDVKIQKAW